MQTRVCLCVYRHTWFCALIHRCNIQMCTYPCKYIATAASMFVWIYAHMKITGRCLMCVYTDICADVSISIPGSLTIHSCLYIYKHIPYIHVDIDICNLDIATYGYMYDRYREIDDTYLYRENNITIANVSISLQLCVLCAEHFANTYIYVSISTYIYEQFPLSVHT